MGGCVNGDVVGSVDGNVGCCVDDVGGWFLQQHHVSNHLHVGH